MGGASWLRWLWALKLYRSGTAFLACAGSGASTEYRAALRSLAAKRTHLTDCFHREISKRD